MSAFSRGVVVALAFAFITVAARPADAAVPQNACRNSVTANNSQISVGTTATATSPVAPGGTITLSNIQQTGTVPGSIFIAGYNLGLLTEGVNNIPASVLTDIEGTNTVEGVQTTSTEAVLIATTINDPDDAPGTGDETATDGSFSVTYDDQTWTAGASPGTVEFRQDTQYPLNPSPLGSEQGALIIRATIGGVLSVRFACSPGTVAGPDPGTVTGIDPAETFASSSIVGPTATAEATPEATATAEATPEATATAEATPEATATAEATPEATATAEATPEATATAEATPEETATPEPTATPTVTATPTLTATATSTVTPTGSVAPTPEPLNHFLCFESHQPAINLAGVELKDQFDDSAPSKATVKKAKRLCLPANKADEDPDAELDPAHLSAYTIRQTDPKKFVPLGPIPVAPDNSILFPMTVKLTRPERLLVPAAKNEGTTVPGALAAPIDHYKCYRVKGAQTRLSGVSVKTQFGTVVVDIKKPLQLCTPVDKNGEGILDPVRHLMCYQVRASAQSPRTVSTNNQFEAKTFDVFGVRELCVPAFKFPGFCGDGELNAPGEECDGSPAPQCASGLCANDCTCEPEPEPLCGNGTIDPGEQCEQNSDCNVQCRGPAPCSIIVPIAQCTDCQCVVPPFCGDGIVNGTEECDDGLVANANNRDCTVSCKNNVCGDGNQNTIGPNGIEACDDGNLDDDDGCDGNCTPTECGNGVQTSDEGCDDGNLTDGDGCDGNCTVTGCGNGITTSPEECDDGNTDETDGCTTDCLRACFPADAHCTIDNFPNCCSQCCFFPTGDVQNGLCCS